MYFYYSSINVYSVGSIVTDVEAYKSQDLQARQSVNKLGLPVYSHCNNSHMK